jgi:ParB-like chromosome segregation protein Spo0J
MGTPQIRRYEQRRTRMKIHGQDAAGGPKYQLMPSLSVADEAALRADIRINGVLVPVVVDEDGEILDGHHRAAIARDEGVEYPVVVQAGLDEAGKFDYVLAVNIARRHLSPLQRYELTKRLRRLHQWSNRRIAEHLGVGESTIRRDLAVATASNGAVEVPARVIGRNNRSFPSGNLTASRLRIQQREQADISKWHQTQERVAPDDKAMTAQARWQAQVLNPLDGVLEHNPEEFLPELPTVVLDRTYATVHELEGWIALAYACISDADRDNLARTSSSAARAGTTDLPMAALQSSTEPTGEAVDETPPSESTHLRLIGAVKDSGPESVKSATDAE